MTSLEASLLLARSASCGSARSWPPFRIDPADAVRRGRDRLRGGVDRRALARRELRDHRPPADPALPDVLRAHVLLGPRRARPTRTPASRERRRDPGVRGGSDVSAIRAASRRPPASVAGGVLCSARRRGWAARSRRAWPSRRLDPRRLLARRRPTRGGRLGASPRDGRPSSRRCCSPLAIGDLVAPRRARRSEAAAAGPFGYANATAAFFAQAFVAALHPAASPAGRRAAASLGAAAVAVAAVVLVTPLVRPWSIVAAAAVVVGARRGPRTCAAAAAGRRGLRRACSSSCSSRSWCSARSGSERRRRRRPAGRRDALGGARRAVARGPVDRGRASAARRRSGTVRARERDRARSTRDLRWAHDEFLQAGAEIGLLGYVLAVGLFLWGFAALGAGPPGGLRRCRRPAWRSLGIQASVDYVLHFPFVVARREPPSSARGSALERARARRSARAAGARSEDPA